jgi:putative aldouronate transport system substrate-binding protein
MSEQQNNGNPSNGLSRRRFVQVAGTMAGGTLLAACGGTTTTNPPAKLTSIATIPPQDVTATATAAKGKTFFPSGDPNIADAYTAPMPAYQSVFEVPGSGDTVNSFAITSQPPVTEKGKNKFWQELEKRLNVTWNSTLVTSDVYPEKVGTLLASGNLPDIFMFDSRYAPSLLQAVNQGAFTDLTPIVTSSSFKTDYPNLGQISPLSWENAKINGKYYTVPRPRPLTGYALYYRKDWAEKVGITDPKSADDFFKLMQAFSQGKLNGGAQTWGMGLPVPSSDFSSSQLAFFFNIFGAPNQWRKNADGTLTHLIETDEFKQALDFIHRLYAAGYFYANSFTQNGQENKDNFSAGKYGAYVDTITGAPDQTDKLLQIHKDAKLSVMTPFNADSSHTANHWMGTGFNSAAAIPTSTGSDENRLKEMLRILNYLASPPFSVEGIFLANGIDGWDNQPGSNGARAVTATGKNEIGNLANQANANLIYYYPSVTANPNLAVELQGFTRNLLKIGIQNPTLGLYSQTATTKSAVLASLVNDRIVRIAKGTDSISAVSDLVSSWKSQGGTAIAKEYESALSKI